MAQSTDIAPPPRVGEGASGLVVARSGRSRPRSLFPWLVLTPVLIYYVVFLLYPLVYAVWVSLHLWIIENPSASKFVLFQNYSDLLLPTSRFRDAFGNTVEYVVIRTTVMVTLGLLLALLLSRFERVQRFYIFCVFAPALCSSAAIAVLWVWLYHPRFGPINASLALLGSDRQGFLTSSGQALYSVIAVDVWQHVGFGAIIFLAGLLNIPEQILEAARIDGAGRWQLFWRVTLPLLSHTTLFMTVVTLIGSFQVFDLILVMTSGGPGYSTYVLSYLIYNEGILRNALGTATAISLVMFAIIILFTIVQFKLLRPRWEY
jgi:ABC-type sugar transport system permease subunit